MPTDCISFRDTKYFSDFVCDYLDKKEELQPFYNRFPTLDNFKLQINEKQSEFDSNVTKKRKILHKVLVEQYKTIDVSKATQANIDSLISDSAFTITTGHQLNLFTGPLYFLYKIISAINLTKQLKKTYPNYNFVPVYWMASEDHDFEEINFFNFKGKKIQWNTNQTGAVGRFDLKGLDKVLDVISVEFGSGNYAQTLKIWFKEAYTNCETLSEATRYLANQLFGDEGLVILDADDRDLKREFIPHKKTELLSQTSFNTVTKTNSKIEALGHKIQVNPREINLFYLDDSLRERILFKDGIYSVNNTSISWTEAEILNHLEETPERFSPNVIMRPLYQEVILPNLCYIGGGGELAYWFQLKSNFELHQVTFPILLLRNSVLIQTKKQLKKIEALGLSTKDMFLKRDSLINKHIRKISNINIDFSEQVKHLQQQFLEIHTLAKQTDKSFIGAVKAQEVKQLKGIEHLEKRLLKAQKKKLADQVSRVADLQEQMFPSKSLQERRVNFSELYLEFGMQYISKLIEDLDPLKGDFSILTL